MRRRPGPATIGLFAWLALATPFAGRSAEPSPPCAAPEHRQWDFWLGDWDVYDVGRPQDDKTVAARARIESILGGCVLREVYQGADGLAGESLSAFDPTRGVWHQTWMTNRGQTLQLEGRKAGEALVFEADDRVRRARLRVEWRPQGDAVRQTATLSRDGGATWQPFFDILFRRHTT